MSVAIKISEFFLLLHKFKELQLFSKNLVVTKLIMAFLVLVSILFATINAQKLRTSKVVGSWAYCTGDDAKQCPDNQYANVTTEIFNNG